MKTRFRYFSILAVALVSILLSLAYLDTCGDDSFIYFRLIENFLRTGQLEYNSGEPCYAMTSVTFFFLFSGFVRWLGQDGGRYAISLLGHIFAVAALFGLGRRLIRNPAVLGLALAAVVLDPFYLRWFWSGWELSFKIAAAAGALWALMVAGERRNPLAHFLAGLAMGFALLTRPEMLFLAGLGAVYVVVRRLPGRPTSLLVTLLAYGGGILLLAGPWMIFAKLYFGWVLPHTVYAKAGGTCSWAYLQAFLPKFIQILFVPALPFYLLAAATVLCLRPWTAWRKCVLPEWEPDFRDFLLVAGWAAMLGGYLVRGVYIDGIKVGLFSPFVLFAVASLLDSALRLRGTVWSLSFTAGWIVILLVMSVALQARLFYRFSSWNSRYAQGDDSNFIAFAKRVKDRTPAEARIGIAELGVVGYYSGRYMIDYVGLATPELVAYQMETGSKAAAVERYYERHGGPATHVVQEFRCSPASAPEFCDFWDHAYRLVDSERVVRIAGRAKPGEYSIYALYELLP